MEEKKQSPFRTFIVDPQGVAREVPISAVKNSADSETQRMMKKWQEEKLARFEKDAVGRLLAIAGLVIVMIAAYFYKGSGGIDTVVAVFGFALLLIGRIIMSRAAYEPSQRTQDALETGTSVIEKIRHWF